MYRSLDPSKNGVISRCISYLLTISILDPEKCIYNHMRYRYYYDPPELLTCIISIRDHWHVGIYSDLVTETPSICASNDQRTVFQIRNLIRVLKFEF